MSTTKLIGIVAMTENGIIAINDELPVKSKYDMNFFKTMTEGHTVIMGRRTFDTIGKPLPNRHNIVITRQKLDTPHKSVYYTDSYVNAFRYVPLEEDKVFIMGGAQIYRDLIPMCDEVYVTVFGYKVLNHYDKKLTIFPYGVFDKLGDLSSLYDYFENSEIIDEFDENGLRHKILRFSKV